MVIERTFKTNNHLKIIVQGKGEIYKAVREQPVVNRGGSYGY